jgi:hypothetical protein
MPFHPFVAPFAILAMVTAGIVLAGVVLRTVAARHRPLAFHVLAVWGLVVLVANGANSLGLAPWAVAAAAAAGVVAFLGASGAVSPRHFVASFTSQRRDVLRVGLVLLSQAGLYLLPLLLIYPAQTLVTGNFVCNDSVHHAVMMLGQDVGETTFAHWPYTTFYPRGIHAVTFGLQALFPVDEAPQFLLPITIWAASFLGLSVLMLLAEDGDEGGAAVVAAASPAGALLMGTSVYLFFLGHVGVLPFLVGTAVIVASGRLSELRGPHAALYLLPAAAGLATYQLVAATFIAFVVGSRFLVEVWRSGSVRIPASRLLRMRLSRPALTMAIVVAALTIPVWLDIARGFAFFVSESDTVGNLPGGFLVPFHVTGFWPGGLDYRNALAGAESFALPILAAVFAVQVWLVARARFSRCTLLVLWSFAVPTVATAAMGMSQYVNFKYLCLLTAVWVPLFFVSLRRRLEAEAWISNRLTVPALVLTLMVMVGGSLRSYAVLPALPASWFAGLERIEAQRLGREPVLVLSGEDWFQYYSDADDVLPLTLYLRKPYVGQPVRTVLIDEAFTGQAVAFLDQHLPGARARLDEVCHGATLDGRFRFYEFRCLYP